MKAALLFLALGTAICLCLGASSTQPLVVEIAQGSLQGIQDLNVRQFLGIPFAAPPVGDLRFRRPTPPSNWEGVYDATYYRADCAQSETGLAEFANRSEDCLYLNVYTPVDISGPLPVMLFFYGGTWQWGGAAFPIYDGEGDVNLAQDVVIVTTNYRLGPFGFLALPELADEDPLGSTGNYGFQDQRMAMQWINTNIAAFGGDPSRVTIWGESAGAASTSAHLTTPASWPFFHGAIMESGPPANWTTMWYHEAYAHAQRIVSSAKCESSSGPDVVACLRNQTTEWLVNNQDNPNNAIPVSWSPVIDGVEFEAPPQVLVYEGKFNRVPILFGTNRNEGTLLVTCPQDANVTEYDVCMKKLFTPYEDEVSSHYSIAEYGDSPFLTIAEAFGDAGMSCPARRAARWFTAFGDTPVFLYFFEHAPLVTSWDPYLGVFHGSELLFVWQFDVVLDSSERNLAKDFAKYWTNFAYTGNPNNGPSTVDVEWPEYNIATDMNLNLNLVITQQTGLKSDLCDFWDAINNATMFDNGGVPTPPY